MIIVMIISAAGELKLLHLMQQPHQFEVPSNSDMYNLTCIKYTDNSIYCCDPYTSFEYQETNWTFKLGVTKCYQYRILPINQTIKI